MVKNLPAMQEIWVWSLSQEDLLEKRMATHTSILAWRIPWAEKSGALQSMWSQRVEHGWVTLFHFHSWFTMLCQFLCTESCNHSSFRFFSHIGHYSSLCYTVGFPCDSDGKMSTCNAGDLSSIPGLGRSPGRGHSNPLQYSCLENSVYLYQGAWWATVHGVAKRHNWSD